MLAHDRSLMHERDVIWSHCDHPASFAANPAPRQVTLSQRLVKWRVLVAHQDVVCSPSNAARTSRWMRSGRGVARGGVEVLRSVIMKIGPWIVDLRRCHLEPTGGELPAPLEKRVWIDARDETHGSWRADERGRREVESGGRSRTLRATGTLEGASGDGSSQPVPRCEALDIKDTETNRTPRTPEM